MTHTDPSHDPLGLGRAPRVLIVDDEPDSLDMFRVLLGSLGWQVETAASYDEAVTVFDASTTDLILSDISLPEADGYSLIAALRDRSAHHIPAIAISGLGLEEDVARSIAAGFDAHLTKPFQLARFFETLDRIKQDRSQ